MAIDFHRINDEQFEDLCRLLVMAENPNAIPIEPLQGDEGIDSFEGVLDGKVEHVWQFKYFPSGIGRCQQDQIRKSLVKAIKKHKPKQWTLFVNADMSTNLHRWWSKQQKDFPKTKLNFVGGSKLIQLLHKHQAIRKDYFDLADAKQDMMLKAMGEQGLLSESKPKAALVADMHHAVEVINDNSPDFKFIFTRVDEECTEITVEPRHAGAMGKTMAVLGFSFPQDDEEARQALADYQKNMREGRPVSVDSRFFTIKESVFDELMPDSILPAYLTMSPLVPDVEVPLRLTARLGEEEEAIPYLAMRMIRQGENEIEFSNEHDNRAAITVNLTFCSFPMNADFTYKLRSYAGKKPSQVIQQERVLFLLGHDEAQVKFESIRDGLILADAPIVGSNREPDPLRMQFFEDLFTIEQRINKSLVMLPDSEGPTDHAVAHRLAQAATGPVTLPSQVVRVGTSPEQTALFKEQLEQNGTSGLALWGRPRETVELFGEPYTSRIHFKVEGDTQVEEQEDGSATVQISGDVWMEYEEILAGVRLEDMDEE